MSDGDTFLNPLRSVRRSMNEPVRSRGEALETHRASLGKDDGPETLLGETLRSEMAKGKKSAAAMAEDSAERPTARSHTETKENEPVTEKEAAGKVQSILQTLQSPNKPRSPLSNSSSMLIQEGNELCGSNADASRRKKECSKDAKCEGLECRRQKPERCKGNVTTDRNEPTSDVKSETGSKASAFQSGSRAARKRESKKTETKAPNNRKVTDYYPIRRSNRKTKTELKNEEHKHIDDLIKNGVEDGMQVQHIEGKGRGIFAVHGFRKGDFVVEYHGDLLELPEAKTREAEYALDPHTGCYMYYFQYQSKTYCVDATRESSRLGRLINHSKNGNCHTRLHPIDGTPHLILVASRDIAAEEELLYDYGDRSKASIQAHPWLKQ